MTSNAAPDARAFRNAVARLATGVTVITTTTADGPVGMTASAVCSLSLEPLQILACVSTALPTHGALERAGAFAVNVLGEDHAELARRFATPGARRFAGVALRDDTALPVLRDAIAYLVCDVRECLPGGDHSIFVGEVTDCGHRPQGRPLLYFNRAFSALEPDERHLFAAWPEIGTLV